MPNEEEVWMCKLRKGLREILSEKLSLRQAAEKYGIGRPTFKRYLEYYDLKTPSEVRYIDKIVMGAPSYLNVQSLTVLSLFGHALDSMDYQLTFDTWREKIYEQKQRECAEKPSSSDVKPPCEHTVQNIIKNLKLPRRSIREGPSVDSLRESKATPTYLCDYFEKLEDLFRKEKITPERIWNCDEVGVQLSDMRVHVYSTKKTIRRDLSNDHLTAHLTVSATGEVMPLYLIFPGENDGAIPEEVSGNPDVWANYSPRGWMDEKRFQAYLLLYIRKIKEIREKSGSTDSHVLLLDGHSSRYNVDTLWTAAVNRIIVFFGPSQLTNCWQANDSGTNKKWKDNLRKELAPRLEAKIPILTCDLAKMVIAAIKTNDIPQVIRNSFRHVGIWPLDKQVTERMIRDEKPTLSNLSDEIQEAIPLVVDHVLKIDEVRQTFERNKEKEKESKKKRKRTFDTSFACIGTSADRMTMLALNKEESQVEKLKVIPLREAMKEKMNFSEADLKNGTKWKPKKELLTMVDKFYGEKAKEMNKEVEATLEKELTRFPAFTPCSGVDFESEPPAKRARE